MLDSTDGTAFRARRVTNRSFPGVLNIQQFDPLIAPYYFARRQQPSGRPAAPSRRAAHHRAIGPER